MSSSASTTDKPLQTKTTCAYCGVGCGIQAEVKPAIREVKIAGDTEHPANYGRLCSKGSALGETLNLNSRLLEPRIHGQTVSWDTALDAVADGFRHVIENHGPDAVAMYVSGQLLTEDYYVANKLMKGFIGSANIDTNSRLCMSSAVAAHKRAFGSDTVPNCYEDLECADLIVLIGSNTAWCHPVAFQRIRDWKEQNPAVKVVVVDPRRTATCDIADLHLPITGGSDVILFNGLLAYIDKQNVLDQQFVEQHTEGFEATLTAAREDAPDLATVAQRCGIALDDVETFFQWFVDTPKTLSVFSQGVNQSSAGVDKANAIINCHLATGRIGKPGSGPFSITGQPNAMGGREVGGLANQLAAHMEFGREDDIDRVARFWNAEQIATKPGLNAVDLFEAVGDGRIKAIWIMATNPVVSLPNADKVKQALSQCDLVVVSDCVARTDTLDLAHIKLPALGWSEKYGTVTNSERCISLQRPLLPPAGNAKPDWWIVTEVAQRLGFEHAFRYQHPAEIFREHAALSEFENNATQRLRDFDISAYSDISVAEYQQLQPTQWPVTRRRPEGTRRLFGDGLFFTPTQRGRFIPVTYRPPVNRPNETHPMILNTGRLRDQWHTMTRTALSPRLNQHRPEPFVEVHPDDAKRLALVHNHLATINSQWGQMTARVRITEEQPRGTAFSPMHWTRQLATQGRIGSVVNPVVDPISGQPESKHTPISIEPYAAGWYGFLMVRDPIRMPDFEYVVSVTSDEHTRYEIAGTSKQHDWRNWLYTWLPERDCDVANAQIQWQQYEDSAASVVRIAGYRNNRLDILLCVAPQPEADTLPQRDWLSSVFVKAELSADERRALLSGVPTIGTEDTGAIVCACFNVGEKTILNAITEHGLTSHQQVGDCCKAGTNCGSCIPEIKTLLKRTQPHQAA